LRTAPGTSMLCRIDGHGRVYQPCFTLPLSLPLRDCWRDNPQLCLEPAGCVPGAHSAAQSHCGSAPNTASATAQHACQGFSVNLDVDMTPLLLLVAQALGVTHIWLPPPSSSVSPEVSTRPFALAVHHCCWKAEPLYAALHACTHPGSPAVHISCTVE
jgi:hypothetical protein